MRALGYLALAGIPIEQGIPNLTIKQIWPPSDGILRIAPEELHNLSDRIPSDLGTSLGSWSEFLATTAVTYDTHGSQATHITTHRDVAIPLSTNFEWCPLLSGTSPFEVERLVNDDHPIWSGPPPVETSPDIGAIANDRYVSGLSLRKQGKAFQITVKNSPIESKPIPRQGRTIIQDANGWFISTSGGLDHQTVKTPVIKESLPMSPLLRSSSDDLTEEAGDSIDLFHQFEQLVASKGLAYDRSDLILLYCSLRAGQFIILAGSGGIGKSSLALAVAEFLHCASASQRLAWLAVEPSWVSSEQLMGRYDPASRFSTLARQYCRRTSSC